MSAPTTPSSSASSPATVSSSTELLNRKTKTVASVATKHPIQVQRRNARERNRVRQVNNGFVTLRNHVPVHGKNKKLSKVDTLREAARYISYLSEVLASAGGSGDKPSPSPASFVSQSYPHYADSAPASNDYSTFSPTFPSENFNPHNNYYNGGGGYQPHQEVFGVGPLSMQTTPVAAHYGVYAPNAFVAASKSTSHDSDPSPSSSYVSDASFDDVKYPMPSIAGGEFMAKHDY